VELTDLFVEGLVPIDSLRDDRYTWRENTHEIIGERTGRRFRAGDLVQVILDRILVQERRLQFSIVQEGIPLTGKLPPKSHPKAKKKKGTSAPGRSLKARGKKGKKSRR
jgi:ribonuclease R